MIVNMKKKSLKRITILWILIWIAFACIEFPGIFFINRIEPMIFGLPFIYGFTLVVWFILCLFLYLGYRMRWGDPMEKPEDEKKHL